MCFDEGIAALDLVQADDVDIHALITAHALGALEFLHAFACVGEPERAGDMVGRREGRHIAGGMPGRAGGQLVLFQKHAVGPARLAEMIER